MPAMTASQKRTAALVALDRLAGELREASAETLCSTLHEFRCAPEPSDSAQDLARSMALALETALKCR